MPLRALASLAVLGLLSACTAASEDAGSSSAAVTNDDCGPIDAEERDDNHSRATATRLEAAADREGEKAGRWRAMSAGKPDWYVFEARDTSYSPTRLLKPSVSLTAGGMYDKEMPLRVCIFVESDEAPDCVAGEPVTEGRLVGCCSAVGPNTTSEEVFQETYVQIDLESAFSDDTQDVYARVDTVKEGCYAYGLGHQANGLVGR